VKNLAIIGGGSWGTALAMVLAPRFERVRLWVYEPDLAERMRANRENDVYLPASAFRTTSKFTTSWPPHCATPRSCWASCHLTWRVASNKQMAPHLDPPCTWSALPRDLRSAR